jgi:glutaredoxin
MEKEIVFYSRSYGCPYVSTAKRVLDRHHLSYREILINQVSEARKRVVGWTGFESVPTIIAAVKGHDLPCEPPDPLPAGASPRGINRGSMITEPSAAQLEEWLRQHAFVR